LQDEGALRGATCICSLGAVTGIPDPLTAKAPARITFRFRNTGVDFIAPPPASHQPAGLWAVLRLLNSGLVFYLH